MKLIHKLLLFASLTLGLVSCNDNFLERSPLDKLSDGYFWKTENDLKVYCNNFYNQGALLENFYYPPLHQEGLAGTDCLINLDYNRLWNGEGTLPASGGGWTYSDWSVLRNINYFMEHYDKAEEQEVIKRKYVGEALFFRSVFYYNMLRKFGDLPWLDHVVDPNDKETLYGGRMPRNQIVDNMMKDLDNAVAYLPARGNGAWTGRVTREVAMALQARIALYEGTWEKYHALKDTKFKVAGQNGEAFIAKAAEVAGQLMKLSEETGYPALDYVGDEDGYTKLFRQKDYSASKEVLFWRKYSVGDNETTFWNMWTCDGHSMGLSKNMVDSYLCMDGKPISGNANYKGDATLKDVVANRDPRLRQTIVVDDGKHMIWNSTPAVYFTTPVFEGTKEDLCSTGYQLYKGHMPDYEENQSGKWTQGAIYFRYAEVLLIYAEAKAELGTITQDDIDKTVNLLRKRVGMTGLLNLSDIADDPAWEFNGLTPVLQEIRRERKVELACENFRKDDIFRWAAADELIVNYRPLGAKREQWENYPGSTAEFKKAVLGLKVNGDGYIEPYQGVMNGYAFNLDRDYLSPIPTDQYVLNPELGQNPGW